MPHHHLFEVKCRSCFHPNCLEIAEVNCREHFICANCGKHLGTSKVLKKAVDALERRLQTIARHAELPAGF